MSECSNSSSLEILRGIVENYGVPHKHLVQLIIKHGILQAHYFCMKFVQYVQVYDSQGNTVTQPDEEQEKALLEKLIVVINNALNLLNLRLIQADDEYDDQNSYIVLLSDQRPSDFIRDACGLTQTEITLFHLWINAICNSENGEISKHEALSMASDLLVKGKKVDEEYLLQHYVSNKWLVMDTEAATIRLGARAIAELQNYFSSYADELGLEKCVVCGKFIVTKNRAIFCEICKTFSHRQCGLKIIKSVRTGKVFCPGKLESGQSCTARLRLPVEMQSVNQNQKGNRKRRIVTNFDEEDECDTAFCSAERLYDAEMQS
uniref:Non-structural maintenance of chromosomes element 1 homolog n=1 Tax=Wuchereria bancrofti TaxID=6293 RepID=A0AAF5RX31_WUCBA